MKLTNPNAGCTHGDPEFCCGCPLFEDCPSAHTAEAIAYQMKRSAERKRLLDLVSVVA